MKNKFIVEASAVRRPQFFSADAPPDMSERFCCVDKCAQVGTHVRPFTIASPAPLGGEIGVDAAFCCFHFDRLWADEGLTVDVKVSGEERQLP